MVYYIQFGILRASIPIEQLISYCGLEMKREGVNYRGPCPLCNKGDNRALVFNTQKGLWYCHSRCKTGGDVISFIAHLNQISTKEAAVLLWRDFNLSGP